MAHSSILVIVDPNTEVTADNLDELDTINAGEGEEFLSSQTGVIADSVDVDLDSGTATITASLILNNADRSGIAEFEKTTSMIFSNIEGLIGSDFDDCLTGGHSGATLIGALGDDTLIGGAGDDFIEGGGIDTFISTLDAAIHGLGIADLSYGATYIIEGYTGETEL